MTISRQKATEDIIAAGRQLDIRGLAPATSGNYSARLADGNIAITVSGAHKGRLVLDDIMLVDADGRVLEAKKPSAEMMLHISLYKMYPEANGVLHAHAVTAVALTRFLSSCIEITLAGYEMLKVFPGISTHETSIDIPVFNNTQDIDALAREVEARLHKNPAPAYIIRDHGIYTWGRDMNEAERVMEGLEHMLACEIELLKLQGQAPQQGHQNERKYA